MTAMKVSLATDITVMVKINSTEILSSTVNSACCSFLLFPGVLWLQLIFWLCRVLSF